MSLPKTYSRDCIPSRNDQIPTPETARKWPHLKRIEGHIAPYDDKLEVALLIGRDCPRAIKPREVILGNPDDPYAVRTLLGWGIVGPVTANETYSEDGTTVTSNRILSKEVGTTGQVRDRFIATIQAKEVHITSPSDIRRVLESDFAEAKNANPATSQEDRQFISQVNKGVVHLPDGHYEIPLPLKSTTLQLLDNKVMAEQRLRHLKKRMEKDQEYKQDYTTFMNSIIEQGYAERVPKEEVDKTGSSWYIPHHGVYHPKKQKIRVVFDCSAKFEGESLFKTNIYCKDQT